MIYIGNIDYSLDAALPPLKTFSRKFLRKKAGQSRFYGFAQLYIIIL